MEKITNTKYYEFIDNYPLQNFKSSAAYLLSITNDNKTYEYNITSKILDDFNKDLFFVYSFIIKIHIYSDKIIIKYYPATIFQHFILEFYNFFAFLTKFIGNLLGSALVGIGIF